MHAYALQEKALRRRDREAARMAIKEAGRAEILIGSDYRRLAEVKMLAFGTSVAIARDQGEELIELIHLPDACAAQLQNSPCPFTCLRVAWHYESIARDPVRAETAFRRAVDLETGDLCRAAYASFLLRHYDLRHALGVFDGAQKRSDASQTYRAILLALDPEGRQQAAAMWKSIGDVSPGDAPRALLVPLFLRDDQRLKEAGQQWRETAPAGQPHWLHYVMGEVSEHDFLQYNKGRPQGIDNMIALKSLAEGDHEKARWHFEAIVDSTHYRDFSHAWAVAFLSQMKQNPDWLDLPKASW